MFVLPAQGTITEAKDYPPNERSRGPTQQDRGSLEGT